ncbi:hypothetical protein ACFPB0_13195 [Glycocaulis abyssi]|uniref:PIN domain-containing protein n=1 Tax=Glycocaulis abyssi TaxID=1433403 RepID=A0ABV9NFM3_9PROT
MIKFTLDTNCLIEVDESRPCAPSIEHLVRSAKLRTADVAIVASSASERQQSGTYLTDFETFRSRMDRLGFGHIEILPPLLRWDMGFWHHGLWAGAGDARREEEIFSVLFPTSTYSWSDWANAERLDIDDTSSKSYRNWRNRILDAQAYWAHEYHQRDIFVTSDQNFRRLTKSPAFPAARILSPQEAERLLKKP